MFRRKPKPTPGCVDGEHNAVFCRPYMAHRPCSTCGGLTCSTTVLPDPASGRRRRVGFCHVCMMNGADRGLRDRRRAKDWTELTEPVDGTELELDQLAEQYAGPTRRTLRAFMESGAVSAEVPRIATNTLNASIASLGLQDDVYAEQRNNMTTLRRVQRAPAKQKQRR